MIVKMISSDEALCPPDRPVGRTGRAGYKEPHIDLPPQAEEDPIGARKIRVVLSSVRPIRMFSNTVETHEEQQIRI